MEFFTNRIAFPVDGAPSFEEWLAGEALKLQKQAEHEAKPECDDDPRGQCRGQVVNTDNEDGAGYQKGESVDGKPDQKEGKKEKKEASTSTAKKEAVAKPSKTTTPTKEVVATCGKEMGECDNAGKVTEKHTPASSTESGSEDKKGKTTEQNVNNDPSYQKGESVDMKKKDEKKANKTMKFQKVSSLKHEQRLALFASLTSNPEYPVEYAEALSGIKFANLKEDEKRWFKDFWSILYPEEYANAMAKDR